MNFVVLRLLALCHAVANVSAHEQVRVRLRTEEEFGRKDRQSHDLLIEEDELYWDRMLLQYGSMSMSVSTSIPTLKPTEDISSSGTPTTTPRQTTTMPTSPPSSAATTTPTPTPTTVAPDKQQWQPFGGRIMPLQAGGVGQDISMSADGTILAVGVPWDAPGYVAVYQLSNATSLWEPLGSEVLDFQDGGEQFGHTVDISADGFTLVAGSGYSDGGFGLTLAGRARIFRYDRGEWRPKGQDLNGETPCRSFGWSVALSGNGNRVVVSTPDVSGSGSFRCSGIDFGDQRGVVQIYDYDESQDLWIQAGADIVGRFAKSTFGVSVAISRNGKRVAAHAPDRFDTLPPVNSTYSVYEQGDDGAWQQLGLDIDTEIAEFYSRGVSLNQDGSRIVVASKRFETGAAFIKILELLQNGTWAQLGDDIEDDDGCCFFYTYENSVAISDDGNRVVFGNSGHEPPGTPNPGIFRGIVRIYDWIEGSWVRVGEPIPGDTVPRELWFGYSTTISGDGRRIAGGAPFGISNYVQAYELV
jgi:hypothetical protein